MKWTAPTRTSHAKTPTRLWWKSIRIRTAARAIFDRYCMLVSSARVWRLQPRKPLSPMWSRRVCCWTPSRLVVATMWVALSESHWSGIQFWLVFQNIQKAIDGFSTVSLLLVEMVSSDIMYNGLPWPDEEFTKVTMERDLQIRRTFKNAPILWPILSTIATHRPSLCFASVLLRGLCASVLHQWRSMSGNHHFCPPFWMKSDGLSLNLPVNQYQTVEDNRELFEVTQKLLQIMSMGQLLPPPLSNLHTVIEHFEPSEIALVLKECIWNYMKENVPSPVLYNVDSSGWFSSHAEITNEIIRLFYHSGLHWRDSSACKPQTQFVDPLRNIILRKLPKLGTFYHHMFILSDANDTTSPTDTEPKWFEVKFH